MIRASPGVSYLLRNVAPGLLVPPTIIFSFYKLALQLNPTLVIPFTSSLRGIVGIVIVSVLARSFVASILATIKRRRDLKQFNAQPIPVILGRLPGNIDLMRHLIKSFPKEYLGDTLFKIKEKNGDLFSWYILGNEYVRNLLQYSFFTWHSMG